MWVEMSSIMVPWHIYVTNKALHKVRAKGKALIHECTIHKTFAACVDLIEAKFPCFNLKPYGCNLATTIFIHKVSQLHKAIILGRLWLAFL